jgi:hypothetical protein
MITLYNKNFADIFKLEGLSTIRQHGRILGEGGGGIRPPMALFFKNIIH